MRLFSLFLFMVALTACNNSGTAEAKPEESIPAPDTPKTEQILTDQVLPPISDSIPFNIQIDTVIHFAFNTNSNELIAKGTLNKRSDPVICYLPLRKKKKLTAQIIPGDGNLNIRFSQLILPDQTSDGPFTRQLNYKLDQSGTYKIIIAPNSMAEGKRSGDFIVKLQIKDY